MDVLGDNVKCPKCECFVGKDRLNIHLQWWCASKVDLTGVEPQMMEARNETGVTLDDVFRDKAEDYKHLLMLCVLGSPEYQEHYRVSDLIELRGSM